MSDKYWHKFLRATSRRCPDEADKHKIHVAERTKHTIDTRQLKATSIHAAKGVCLCV